MGLGSGLLIASTLSMAGYLSVLSSNGMAETELVNGGEASVESVQEDKKTEADSEILADAIITPMAPAQTEGEVPSDGAGDVAEDIVEDVTGLPLEPEEPANDPEPEPEEPANDPEPESLNEPETQQQTTVRPVPQTPSPATPAPQPAPEAQQQTPARAPEPQQQTPPEPQQQAQPPEIQAPSGPVTITIAENSSNEDIARELSSHGIVSNTDEFSSYLDQKSLYVQYRPGTYEIESGGSFDEIIDGITKGN